MTVQDTCWLYFHESVSGVRTCLLEIGHGYEELELRWDCSNSWISQWDLLKWYGPNALERVTWGDGGYRGMTCPGHMLAKLHFHESASGVRTCLLGIGQGFEEFELRRDCTNLWISQWDLQKFYGPTALKE